MAPEPFFNKRQRLNPVDQNDHLKPWVEKYRPKKLDDVAAQKHAVTVLKRTLQSANLPHMLFYGPPGTGKTSTILALTKELFGPELMKSRVLELNASDERGISIVREKVKNFARLTVTNPTKEDLERYPCPPYKIIILDEADSMTADAQSALRRTMETYSTVTRFCLICNYVTRIIDPLTSRCSKFRFKPLDETNALSRLQYIAKEEGLTCSDKALVKTLDIAEGDLRRAITLLQSAAKAISFSDSKEITSRQIEELAGVVPDEILMQLIDKVNSKNLDDIIKYVNDFIKSGWSASSVIAQLHDYYVNNNELGTKFKNEVFKLLFETDSRLTHGTNEHLQLLNLVMKISQL
ncbi:HFL281Cp [Eremothecium sinecaudum]|uniref:Replication factor C subunit 2 n=1 Tax=Eremothecium sinecaudum TaxID=45286 RepID=A0A0X8HUC0_9SACH|nr:HFL281Cp [Eremothecium sinecaudum]AMD21575.1 HFL281Cp [Eremothecium sinecaudum]